MLLVVQVLLGAVTVKLALPPWVIITHLANAMAAAGRADDGGAAGLGGRRRDRPRSGRTARHPDHRLVLATAALGFVVILFGAQVANFHAGLLCLGFPLCNGGCCRRRPRSAALHWTHRVLAFAFLALAAGDGRAG